MKKLKIIKEYGGIEALIRTLYNSFEMFIIELQLGNYKKIFNFFKIYIKSKFLNYPFHIMIESTNICNLRCVLCPTPNWKMTRKKGVMNLKVYKKIIDKIKNYSYSIILYFSGEPLLNKNIFEMIKYTEDNNMKVVISTNAVLLDEDTIQKLLESNLSNLIISLDGASNESYNKYRIGSNFDLVSRNIKNLCRKKKEGGYLKPIIDLQFIVTRYSEPEINKIKELANDWGVDILNIKGLTIPTYAYNKEEAMKLAKEFLPKKEKKKFRLENGNPVIIRRPETCNVYNIPVVLITGDTVMCCYDFDGKYIFGNLLNKDFKKIWKSKTYRKARRMMKKRELPLCKECTVG